MIEKYESLRAALGAGPTPGPWFSHDKLGYAVATVGKRRIAADSEPASDPCIDIRYLIAVDPTTIRDLLAERDRLREALRWTAAAFQAVANEADEFRIDTVKRTAREILDLADAALAQEQGESK